MLNLIYASITENMETKQRAEFDDSLVERDPADERARRMAMVAGLGGDLSLC